MAFNQRLGKVFLCAVLGFAAFGGAYVRPDEIEDLMDCMNRRRSRTSCPKSARTGTT